MSPSHRWKGVDVHVYCAFEINPLLVWICQQLTLCAPLPPAGLCGTAEASCSTVPLSINTFNTNT